MKQDVYMNDFKVWWIVPFLEVAGPALLNVGDADCVEVIKLWGHVRDCMRALVEGIGLLGMDSGHSTSWVCSDQNIWAAMELYHNLYTCWRSSDQCHMPNEFSTWSIGVFVALCKTQHGRWGHPFPTLYPKPLCAKFRKSDDYIFKFTANTHKYRDWFGMLWRTKFQKPCRNFNGTQKSTIFWKFTIWFW